MKIVLLVCIVVLLVVICAMKMAFDALSLYIKDMGITSDKEIISNFVCRCFE